jgi:hypothetical protein
LSPPPNHTIGYACVTIFWLLAGVWRPGRGEGRFPRAMLAIVVGFAILGALVEVIQNQVHRTSDPLDWLADLVVVVVALAAWTLLRQRAKTTS